MLTEYIGSGTTVEAAIDAAYELDDDAQFASAMARLARLRDAAVAALRSLHGFNVVHADLEGRNMVLCGEQVGLVDFGSARIVQGELRKLRWGRETDMNQLESVFPE